jgi:hypothetical protein
MTTASEEVEVDSRRVLLLSDGTLRIISSKQHPDLLELLSSTRALHVKQDGQIMARITAMAETEGWSPVDNGVLRAVLNEPENLRLGDLPEDVLESYLLKSVIMVTKE